MFAQKTVGSRLLSFVDERHGWIVGFDSDVFRTQDGGRAWEKQRTEAQEALNAVFFVNSDHGWTVGDGGKTWSLSASHTTADLLDVFFFDTSHGWPWASLPRS